MTAVCLSARVVRRFVCLVAAMMLMMNLAACRSTDGAEDPVLGLRATVLMPGPAGVPAAV